jgi:hypothetical protein
LDATLLHASLKDLLHHFFSCLTPEKLITHVQRQINESLQDPLSGLYIPLSKKLDSLPKPAFLLDPMSGEVEITLFGATSLLLLEGYLKERCPPKTGQKKGKITRLWTSKDL